MAVRKVRDSTTRKARVGLIMLAVYLLVYAGFVVVNTAAPRLMAVTVTGGLGLAVVYGMALIVLAVLIKLIYNSICAAIEAAHGSGEE